MKNYIKLLGVVCLFLTTMTVNADYSLEEQVARNNSEIAVNDSKASLAKAGGNNKYTLGDYQGDGSSGDTFSGAVDTVVAGDNIRSTNTSTTKVDSSTTGMYGMAGSATTTNLTTSYGQDLCMGSWTAGASAMGIGFSGGSTISDNNCERLRNVKLLNDLGLKDVALTTLCENKAVRIAMKRSRPAAYNKLCAVWDEHEDMDDFLEAKIDDSGKIFDPNAENSNLEESPKAVEKLVNKYKISKHP